jgi:hypothetical protein
VKNLGQVFAQDLFRVLQFLKPSLVEKLCWEQNLDYLSEDELKQLENAYHKSRELNCGIKPDTFYQ